MSPLTKILADLYRVRYSKKEIKLKSVYWKILCSDFLQKYINKTDTVLDIASGHCEFINNIKCLNKFAVDIDQRIRLHADSDVRVIISSAENLPTSLTGKVDVVFMGCLLEHLPSKDAIISVFKSVKKILKPGGKLLILNPNIRFTTADFWDYFDHLTPVSDRSIVEVLKALYFQIDYLLPRFVPNTIKDSLPKPPILVKMYLRLPFLFPIFGKQMFIVARKKN